MAPDAQDPSENALADNLGLFRLNMNLTLFPRADSGRGWGAPYTPPFRDPWAALAMKRGAKGLDSCPGFPRPARDRPA